MGESIKIVEKGPIAKLIMKDKPERKTGTGSHPSSVPLPAFHGMIIHTKPVMPLFILFILTLLCFAQPCLAMDQLLVAPPFFSWPLLIAGLIYGLIIGNVIIGNFNTSRRFTYLSMMVLFCFIFEFGVNIANYLQRAGSDVPHVIDNYFMIFWPLILPIISLWIVCYYAIKKEERTFFRSFKVALVAIVIFYFLSFFVFVLFATGFLDVDKVLTVSRY